MGGQSGDNVYSMLFQFKSAPGAEFKKIARDAGNNKWRVSYRRMTNDFIYVNPWGNKYIQGGVYDEAGKKFNMKILLPHKTFGWYINDDQGNKIKNAMNKSATTRSQTVGYHKQLLRKQFPNYKSVKAQYDAISKNKADYEAYVEAQKKELEKLKGQIDGLRTTAADSQKAVDAANNDVLAANAALEELLRQESALGSKKTAIVETIEELSKSEADLAGKKKMFVEDVKKVLDAEFDALKKNIAPKVAEADNAKRDLYAMKKADYQSHMNKIYP